MILVNGGQTHYVDVNDRGLHYGDGLFETLRIENAEPCYWPQHLQRLLQGCRQLLIPEPDIDLLHAEALKVSQGMAQGVLKIIVSRGAGQRGYKPPTPTQASRILMSLPFPAELLLRQRQGLKVMFCNTPLACHPSLGGIKHLNRLEQVLAAAELEAPEIDEGIMLDLAGTVIEATMNNVFLVKNGEVHTPDLERCGVYGIMRQRVLELLERLAIPCKIRTIQPKELLQADELFLSNSVMGVRPIVQLGEHRFAVGALTKNIMAQTHFDVKTE